MTMSGGPLGPASRPRNRAGQPTEQHGEDTTHAAGPVVWDSDVDDRATGPINVIATRYYADSHDGDFDSGWVYVDVPDDGG